MSFRMLAVATTVSVGFLLTGCVSPEPVVTPVETTGAQPIFASDEEALAAAVEAYEGYSTMIAEISNNGGEEADQISEFVSKDLLELELAGFAEFRELGIRLIGSVRYFSPKLQQHWQDENDQAHVIAYFCADASSYSVVKGTGEPYRPDSVPHSYVVEVRFGSHAPKSSRLVVEEVGEWSDPTGC